MATIDHSKRAHALCSPSSAHRWTQCPLSVILSAGFPETPPGPAAERGTRAHEAAQACLEFGFDVADLVSAGRYAESDPEWIDATQRYVDYVRMYLAFGDVVVEQRVTVSDHVSGTPDAIAFCGDGLHVFDLKTGRGEVAPERNEQLMLYAAGAARAAGVVDATVTLHIFQPFNGGAKTWVTTARECYGIADGAAAIARYIHDVVDGGCAHEPRAITGGWCAYCPATHVCPANAAEFDAVASLAADAAAAPASVDAADLLPRFKRVRAFMDAIEARARADAYDGRPPRGYKLVQGAGRRQWAATMTDAEVARHLSGTGIEPFTQSLLSPAQAEKQLGRKEFSTLCGDIVEIRHSAALLVPIDDKRPAYDPAADGQSFEPLENGSYE